MAGEGVLATLEAGWQALAKVDAPKAVIGGLAMTAWKHARYTRDADVLVAIEAGRVDELVTAVSVAATSSIVSLSRSVYGAGIRQPLVEGCPTIA